MGMIPIGNTVPLPEPPEYPAGDTLLKRRCTIIYTAHAVRAMHEEYAARTMPVKTPMLSDSLLKVLVVWAVWRLVF